ncbi:MAG TPA: calcium-binding protein [Allosphingosinicella sp.]|nr:calcium-binding protein [Allosphingosinicella sp.]
MADFNGSSGNDTFTGGAEDDTAKGKGGNDSLSGAGGFDRLVGDGGSDTLDGGADSDWLFSAEESPPFSLPYYDNPFTAPVLDTGSTIDTLRGGAGDDTIFAGYRDDVDGGSQDHAGDRLFISFLGAGTGVTVDFRLASQVIGGGTITGIENISWVQGSNFDDDINVATNFHTGYSDFTAVFGMGGDDRLVAGYYTGTLFGGSGNDVVDGRPSQYLQEVDGGDGDDTLYTNSNTFGLADGGAGNDIIYSHGQTYGGDGDDLIILQQSYYAGFVFGDDGNDEIRAAAWFGNFIIGGNGADVLLGEAAGDVLVSAHLDPETSSPANDMGRERDSLSGGGGDDQLAAGYGDNVNGGTGTDSLSLSLGGSTKGLTIDTTAIAAGTPYSLGGGTIQNVETLAYLRGTNFADTLKLATQAELLTVDAGNGSDTIYSNNSSVAVAGGTGNDRFVSGAAGDTFDGGTGTDTIDYRNSASGVTVTLALVAGNVGSGAGGDELTNVENIDGSAHGDTLNGSDDANVINGMAGNDTIKGNGGNDLIDGGAGADTMRGGPGDDLYTVDDAADLVDEASGGGTDRVNAAVHYALGAGEHVETLATTDRLGTTPIELSGNELANTIYGNAGANVIHGGDGADLLDGGAGADDLHGGGDDDSYVIDSAADKIFELAGEGTDSATSSVTYKLADHVENLTLAGGGAINGTGNDLANTLTGNDSANTLNGGANADMLLGGKGHDLYVVDHAGDKVVETGSSGTDTVQSSVDFALPTHVERLVLTGSVGLDGRGNSGANSVTGNSGGNLLNGGSGDDNVDGGAGNDSLYGSLGMDVLKGGAGLDRFLFNTALGSTNVDNIVDFSVPADSIYLARYVFTRAGATGTLGAAAFRQGTAAADASDRIVYDQATGQIFYDSDGSGAAAQILFATVAVGTALTNADFVVYG